METAQRKSLLLYIDLQFTLVFKKASSSPIQLFQQTVRFVSVTQTQPESCTSHVISLASSVLGRKSRKVRSWSRLNFSRWTCLNPSAAPPIVHSSAYFHSPLHVGDLLIIHLKPRLLSTSSFEVASEVLLEDQAVATARLRHVAINPSSRERCRLPEGIERWLEASSVGNIQPL